MRVATGDVGAFVLAVMLLLCFGTGDAAAANDDNNNIDDQGLFVIKKTRDVLYPRELTNQNASLICKVSVLTRLMI